MTWTEITPPLELEWQEMCITHTVVTWHGVRIFKGRYKYPNKGEYGTGSFTEFRIPFLPFNDRKLMDAHVV